MKTAMQELIRFIDNEVALDFLDKKYAERIKWYIDNCFIEKEKEQIINAHIDGQSLVSCKDEYAEEYYNETYNQN